MMWDELTTLQIDQLNRNIPVLLPVSATEQHGPLLPLATDRLIAEHFAAALQEEMPENILILPTVSVGCSDHHMSFAGTLSLSHHTFAAIVEDLIGSVLQHGFNKIILFNSHGGNQAICQVILERLGFRHPHAHFVSFTWWVAARAALQEVTETGPGGTGHACEFETSLMQLITGRYTDLSQIEKGGNVPTFAWAESDMLRGSKASYYRLISAMTPNGIFGDPLKASPAKGKMITDCVIKELKIITNDLHAI